MLRTIFTPTRLVMGVFFMQSVVLANWYPRIPDMQETLAVGPGGLAVALMGMPIGTFLSLAVVGSLIQRFTPRRTILYGFFAYCAAIVTPGLAWNVPSLFVGLLLVGATYPIVDVSMNVAAAEVQAAVGRRIMSTCHGFWSIGAMVGALIGAGFAQLAIPTALHLAIIAVIALPISVAIALSLPKSGEGRSAAPSGTPFAMPTVGMLGLCVFAVGAIMVETAARNWSAVFLRDEVHASPGMAGLGFSVFGLFMAGGRLIGDRMADRFGAVAFARACCLCTLVGLLILATAANAAVGFAGLAAAGFGVSVLFPLSVSAAAARGDRPAALNVAALALVAYSGSLAAAPLIGFVAEAAGLRIGMGAVIPAILLSTLLAGELTRRASLGGGGAKAGA